MTYTLVDTLYYYDQPMLWTAKDKQNKLWAAIMISDTQILFCSTYQYLVDMVIENTLPVRALFDQSLLLLGTWEWKDNSTGTFAFLTLAHEDTYKTDLPKPGVLLNPTATS